MDNDHVSNGMFILMDVGTLYITDRGDALVRRNLVREFVAQGQGDSGRSGHIESTVVTAGNAGDIHTKSLVFGDV